MAKKEKDKTKTLEDSGISSQTVKKLRDSGYRDLESCGLTSPNKIAEQSGVSKETALKVFDAAYKEFEMGKFKTGTQVEETQLERRTITTGVKALDEILGGKGVRAGEISGFSGKYGSAKTQSVFQITVNSMLPLEKGGLGGDTKVIFFDSEHTFSAYRIKQIAIAKGLDPDKVISNIFYMRVYNSLHQARSLNEAWKLFDDNNIGLVVVDSLIANFRADYIGRSQLAERQALLNKYIHELLRMAMSKNIPVVVTNQVMDRPDVMFGDPTVMVGGNVVGHALNPNIMLRRGKLDIRFAKVKDASDLPESEAAFRVTDNGLEEYVEKEKEKEEKEE